MQQPRGHKAMRTGGGRVGTMTLLGVRSAYYSFPSLLAISNGSIAYRAHKSSCPISLDLTSHLRRLNVLKIYKTSVTVPNNLIVAEIQTPRLAIS